FIEDFSKIAKSLTVLTQKSKTFDWGEEQENSFQTLKDKLCNAPVLALPDGLEFFLVYCDASGLGLGCVLIQRGKLIAYASRQLKIHEKNYTTHDLELEIFSDYDCEIRYNPGKSSIKDRILAAQKEVFDESVGLQRGLDEMIELRNDGALYYLDRIWVPLKSDRLALVTGNEKGYSCLWIAMNFVTKLQRTSSGHDTIWVIMDRLSKFAHFLPMREDYKMDRLARLYLNEIVARHGVPISIISDHDSRFMSSYHSNVRGASFEALYGRKCRSPIIWAEVGEVAGDGVTSLKRHRRDLSGDSVWNLEMALQRSRLKKDLESST
ncbi:putative reverse transcriptase domain-containing protein, partial [Tanacetum coccineum]